MKTRTFNLLPVLLVALGIMAGFTACEEKEDEGENSILGYWKMVEFVYPDGSALNAEEGTGHGDGLLRIYHFQKDGMFTGYEHYEYDGNAITVGSSYYTYEPLESELTLFWGERKQIYGASLIDNTLTLEQMLEDGSCYKYICNRISEKVFNCLTEGFEVEIITPED